MTTPMWLAVALVALGVAYVVVPTIVPVWRRLRGPRIVRCPETGESTEVELDAVHAAAGAAVGEPELRVARCERWPERHDCDQRCLAGIERVHAESHGLLAAGPKAHA